MVAGGVIVPAVLAVVLRGIDPRPIEDATVRRGVDKLLLGPTSLTAAQTGRAVGCLDNPVVYVGQSQPILRSWRALPRIPFIPPFPQSLGQYHRTRLVFPVNVLTTIRSLSLLTGCPQLPHSIVFITPSL